MRINLSIEEVDGKAEVSVYFWLKGDKESARTITWYSRLANTSLAEGAALGTEILQMAQRAKNVEPMTPDLPN